MCHHGIGGSTAFSGGRSANSSLTNSVVANFLVLSVTNCVLAKNHWHNHRDSQMKNPNILFLSSRLVLNTDKYPWYSGSCAGGDSYGWGFGWPSGIRSAVLIRILSAGSSVDIFPPPEYNFKFTGRNRWLCLSESDVFTLVSDMVSGDAPDPPVTPAAWYSMQFQYPRSVMFSIRYPRYWYGPTGTWTKS